MSVGDAVDAQKWLNDREAIQDWFAKYDLKDLLQKGGGFVRMENFLPTAVAELALTALEKLPEKAWERTGSAARTDVGYVDSIPHHFSLCEIEEDDSLMTLLLKHLWRLLPFTLPNFTAARYTAADHIAPHDDDVLEKYTWNEVKGLMNSFSVKGDTISHSHFGLDGPWRGSRSFTRKVAVVYYLNKNWPIGCGGDFVDLQTGRAFSPEFNTLVAFEVPRMHMVTAVESLHSKRYSVFGWWLAPETEEKASTGRKSKHPQTMKRQASSAPKVSAKSAASRTAMKTIMKAMKKASEVAKKKGMKAMKAS